MAETTSKNAPLHNRYHQKKECEQEIEQPIYWYPQHAAFPIMAVLESDRLVVVSIERTVKDGAEKEGILRLLMKAFT